MRPPMLAGPRERASIPPKVLESISASAARATAAPVNAPIDRPAAARQRADLNVRRIHVSLEKTKREVEESRGKGRRPRTPPARPVRTTAVGVWGEPRP